MTERVKLFFNGISHYLEGVYVTIENPAFCLFLNLTGLHFRGELKHVGDVSQQKIICRLIRTREIDGVLLSDVLFVMKIIIVLMAEKLSN